MTNFPLSHNIDDLIKILAKLRDPKTGCAWNLQQDYHSLIVYTREEVEELSQAIQNKDVENLCEELGDLLFHIVYYAQIAQEQDAFHFHDVVNKICQKLIRRHPHIFDPEAKKTTDLAEITKNWQKIKEREKTKP